MEIVIDWSTFSSQKAFYAYFLATIEAPDWHGKNLDALQDSMVNGGINGVAPPYIITNLNVSLTPQPMQTFMRSVLSVFADSAIAYPHSTITIKSSA